MGDAVQQKHRLGDGPPGLKLLLRQPRSKDEVGNDARSTTGEEHEAQPHGAMQWCQRSPTVSTGTPPLSPPSTPRSRGPKSRAASQPEATRVQLPEEGLVDLEEAEGRKRGSELLMLLGTGPEKAPPPPSPVAPRPARGSASGSLLSSANAVPFVPQQTATSPPPVEGAPPPSDAAGRSPQSAQQSAAEALAASSYAYLSILREAAVQAFGEDVACVEGDLRSGFTVQLSDRSRHCAALERLEELATELWPLLPVDSVSGLQPGAIGKRAWLTMHYVLPAPPNSCWDYATTGSCPRGQLCRWLHALPQNLSVDIEVTR